MTLPGQDNQQPVSVLFVCTGNICRSPSAEGVFRSQIEALGFSRHLQIDSAGTHGYHVGSPPDPRSVQAARDRGVDIASLQARQVCMEDFETFDWLLVMDEENHRHMMRLCPQEYMEKVRYFLSFAPQLNRHEVPDPYYGVADGFERVLDLIEAASEGLIQFLQEQGRLPHATTV